MQIANQLADDVFDDALVAVVLHARHDDALFAGGGDVDVCTLLLVQAAAHADIAQVRAAGHGLAAHAGGVADEGRVRVADAADDLLVVRGETVVQDNLFGKLMQALLRRGEQVHRLNGHDFLKHRSVLLSI